MCKFNRFAMAGIVWASAVVCSFVNATGPEEIKAASNPLVGKWTGDGYTYYVYPNGFVVMKYQDGDKGIKLGWGKFAQLARDDRVWHFVGSWFAYPYGDLHNNAGPFRMRKIIVKDAHGVEAKHYSFEAWVSGGAYSHGPGGVIDDRTDLKRECEDAGDPKLPNDGDVSNKGWKIVSVLPKENDHLKEGDFVNNAPSSYSILGAKYHDRLIIAHGISVDNDSAQGTVYSGFVVDARRRVGGSFKFVFFDNDWFEGTLLFDEADNNTHKIRFIAEKVK